VCVAFILDVFNKCYLQYIDRVILPFLHTCARWVLCFIRECSVKDGRSSQ